MQLPKHRQLSRGDPSIRTSLEHAKVEHVAFQIPLNRGFQVRRPLERQDPHAQVMHQCEDHERVLSGAMCPAKQDRSSSRQARLKPALGVGLDDERELGHREAFYGSPKLWRCPTTGIQEHPQVWREMVGSMRQLRFRPTLRPLIIAVGLFQSL